MTKPWTAETREYARRLAVQQVCEGQTIREAADFVGASISRRGITPQLPQRKPRERDDEAIAAWVRYKWPRIKKKPEITPEH